MVGEADRRNGVGAELAHHDRIREGSGRGEDKLDDGGSGDDQDVAVQGAELHGSVHYTEMDRRCSRKRGEGGGKKCKKSGGAG